MSDSAASTSVPPIERLVSIVQELSLARDIAAIQAIARRAARELTGADGATFVLRDGDRCYYADEDAIAPLWKGQRFPMEHCISGWVMRNRQGVVIPDIYADPRIPADAYRPTFVKSLAMVPIRTADPIGAIGNYWAQQRTASAEEVKLLQALADSTSIAIESAQLYQDLERRVRDRTAALELINQELEAFSYSVSHDLRAPLRSIAGFAQILVEDHAKELSEEAKHCVERVVSSGRRMGELIDALLSLARVSRSEPRYAGVDLSALAREIALELDPEGSTTFRVEDGLQAWGDAALLRTVLENLLRNAWKFTRGRPEPKVVVERVAEAEEPTFAVRDNGAGFDMQYAKKLFAPFQRLHGAEFEGTGIGLSIVHRVIRRHGGRVWAEGAVDRGATVFFTLPARG
jgi:signal transduction histidine kinase